MFWIKDVKEFNIVKIILLFINGNEFCNNTILYPFNYMCKLQSMKLFKISKHL